ncbi:MAG: hypothetical protein ACOCP2_01760 [Halohasta sp.]
MCRTDRDHRPGRSPPRSRRGVLKTLGGLVTTPLGIGSAAYGLDRSYRDADGDGVPDSLEADAEFEAWLTDVFGDDQFTGLDSERRELLIDARYVGGTRVRERTKSRLVALFRANGIHLQWLDYPDRYDRSTFERRYGYNVREILWSPRSFYHREVERRLKNVALQLIVVPGFGAGPHREYLYSSWTALDDGSGYVQGFNTGNRAVVAGRHSQETAAKLICHEIAHYALCHSTDPENTGVMGSQKRLDLEADEWAALRDGLGAIRDTTGFDVAFQRCLWAEQWATVADSGGLGVSDRHVGSINCAGCRVD